MCALSKIKNFLLNLLPWNVFHVADSCKLRYCVGRHINGVNNSIIIGNSNLHKCNFFIKGNNNTIVIGDKCKFNRTSFWISGDNNRIEIGSETTVGQNCQFAVLEGTSIVIGQDCMFSHDIRVRTSDSHSIIDSETGARINHAKNITIGDHCWIGMYVLILKGAVLSNNTIAAARSIVNKQFEDGVLVGGSPAKVLKRHLTWDRRRL